MTRSRDNDERQRGKEDSTAHSHGSGSLRNIESRIATQNQERNIANCNFGHR